MGTSLRREHKDKMSRQRVRAVSRIQALEGRRSSLDREGLQRPCLNTVSSYLAEMTLLGYGLTIKSKKNVIAGNSNN